MNEKELRANRQVIDQMIEEWEVLAWEGGKIDGPGYGGKIHYMDPWKDFSVKFILLCYKPEKNDIITPPLKPDQPSSGNYVISYVNKAWDIPSNCNLMTKQEIVDQRSRVNEILGDWGVGCFKTGKVDGPAWEGSGIGGSGIYEGDPYDMPMAPWCLVKCF